MTVQPAPEFISSAFVRSVNDWVATELDHAANRAIPFVDHPCAPLRLLRRLHAAGGKGFRPEMVNAGLRLGHARERETMTRGIQMAGAVELMHLFGLIQDDVVDGASTRRGVSTAHVYVADRLPARDREADRRFAEGLAVLAGDLSLAIADEAVAGETTEVLELWQEMKFQMITGQVGDVLSSVTESIDDDVLRQISLQKSGRYSVALPLRLGVRMAAPDLDDAVLAEAADRLGLLFQVIDDLRDRQPARLSGKDQHLDQVNTKRRYSDILGLDSTTAVRDHVDRELDEVGALLAGTGLDDITCQGLDESFRALAASAA